MAGDIKKNKAYWDNFYKKDFVDIPSQFCVYVATCAKKGSLIVELGCGNGRDSLFFSKMNFRVLGVDLSLSAIETCNIKSARENDIQFICGDISDLNIYEDISKIIDSMSSGLGVCFYSRFVMHSIDDQQQESFILAIRNLMQKGDKIFFEFRSLDDKHTAKIFDNHYRRYVDTDQFIKKLEKIAGLDVVYSITGRGMAMFKNEDPSVSRVVAKKS